MLRKSQHFLAVMVVLAGFWVALLGFLEAGAFAMSVPNKTLSVPYDKTKSPAADVNPQNARPIGLGNIATGGDTLSLSVALDEFPGAVDVYLAATASGDATHAYFLNSDGAGFSQFALDGIVNTFQAGGIKPWKAGTTGPINEALLGDIPVANIPAGTYNLYLLVTTAGDKSLSKYYLWNTSFDSAFTLTVNKFGKGSAKSDLEGINCGDTCAGSYQAGKVVTLTAEASTADGYEFRHWAGCDSWSGHTCTVSMDRSKMVSLVFGKPIVPSDNVTSLSDVPDDTMKLLVSQSGGTYTFDKSATTLLGFKAGNIFFNMNSGIRRKVTKVSTDSAGQIVIETTEAKLEDLIKTDGTLSFLAENMAIDLAATKMAPGFSIRESSTKPGSYVIEAHNVEVPLEAPLLGPIRADNQDDNTAYCNAHPGAVQCSYCGTDHKDALYCFSETWGGESTSSIGGVNLSLSGKLMLGGYINFSIDGEGNGSTCVWDLKCGYGTWPLHEFHAIFELKNENRIEVIGEAKLTVTKEIYLGSIKFTRIPIWIFWVTPQIQFYIGLNGEVKATLQTGIEFDQQLKAGVRFGGDTPPGDWQSIWEYNKTVKTLPLTFKGEVGIKGYVRPHIAVEIDDLIEAALSIDVVPYLRAAASISNTPGQCGLDAGLYAGIGANLVLSAKVAGYGWDPSWELYKKEWDLATWSKPYHFHVKPTKGVFHSSASTDKIDLTFDNSICAWTAETKTSWITLNNLAGYGSSKINYSVSANTAKTGRTGTITINGEDFTVNQAGDGQMNLNIDAQDSTGAAILQGAAASPALESISARTADRNAPGSLIPALLDTGTWRIVLNETLPHVVSDPKGMYCNEFPCTKSFDTGSSVKLTAYNGSFSDLVFTKWTGAPCEGITAETCTVTMSSDVNVAAVYAPKFLSISGITSGKYKYLNTYASFTATSGAGNVYVSSNYAWTAVSNASWITITSGSSGKGNGTVAYSVSENTTGAKRTGTITIGDKIFTVYQGTYMTLNLYVNDHLPSGTAPGTGAGSVTITPSGKTCTANCTQSFAGSDPQYGVFVYLTATASANSVFRGWYPLPRWWFSSLSWKQRDGVDCRTSSGTCRIEMISDSEFDRDIAAVFDSCTYSISSTSQTGDANALSGAQISVTASSGCAWTAVSNASWITLTSGASGTGSGTVIYSVSANTGASSRTGTITVAGQTFTYTQAGAQAQCTYSISPTSQTGDANALSGAQISVTASSGCAWTAVSNASWITITSGSSGTGSGTVVYSVSANTGTSSRTGTITVAGQTFTYTQAGASCTYSILPTSQTGDANALSGAQISVTASSGCAWTAVSNASWITLTSGSSGTGSGTVVYSVSANTGASSRTGTITVAGQTFTYTQAVVRYWLTVNSSSGLGIVTSSPSGINCNGSAGNCSTNAMFDSGTAVTLTATPSAGYWFAGWSGGGCSGTGTCTVTMNSNVWVTATFYMNVGKNRETNESDGGLTAWQAFKTEGPLCVSYSGQPLLRRS